MGKMLFVWFAAIFLCAAIIEAKPRSVKRGRMSRLNEDIPLNYSYCSDVGIQSFDVTGLTLQSVVASGSVLQLRILGAANATSSTVQSNFVLGDSIKMFEDNQEYDHAFAPGDQLDYTYRGVLPFFIPTGQYTSTLGFKTSEGVISCIKFQLTLVSALQRPARSLKQQARS